MTISGDDQGCFRPYSLQAVDIVIIHKCHCDYSCHDSYKQSCKLCQNHLPLAMGARFTVFGQAGHADPLDGWCCSS